MKACHHITQICKFEMKAKLHLSSCGLPFFLIFSASLQCTSVWIDLFFLCYIGVITMFSRINISLLNTRRWFPIIQYLEYIISSMDITFNVYYDQQGLPLSCLFFDLTNGHYCPLSILCLYRNEAVYLLWTLLSIWLMRIRLLNNNHSLVIQVRLVNEYVFLNDNHFVDIHEVL